MAFDLDKGCHIDLDIALAHPWSSDIFPKSSESDGAAAERKDREKRRKAKYAKETLPGRSTVSFIPLVIEHIGQWGEMGRTFLERLAKKSRDELGRSNTAEFLDIWRKRFSTQLQKCNAKVIMRKSQLSPITLTVPYIALPSFSATELALGSLHCSFKC